MDFSRETMEVWTALHQEVSQFTCLKGRFCLMDGAADLSCADFGEAYTGRYDWDDYEAEFLLEPLMGEEQFACVRVQGGVRSYFAGLSHGRLVLLKNTRQGLKELAAAPLEAKAGEPVSLRVTANGNRLTASIGETRVEAADSDRPYLRGGIGLAVRGGSRLRCRRIAVR